MATVLSRIHTFLWGAPALLLILGAGIYLTIQLRGTQFTLFPGALHSFLEKLGNQDSAAEGTTPFRALCTALAATVGTGNLVGVAGAICLGGPGAIFWMWVSGALGMVTKYAEAALAVRYRVKARQGYIGGPMYVMTQGLGRHWRIPAIFYCIFGMAATFGVGTAAQVNAVISGINGVLDNLGTSQTIGRNLAMGVILAVVLGTMLLGGAKRIGAAAEILVPFAAAAYIVMCLGILICKADAIPGAFAAIFQGAFSPRAVTGGVIGSGFQAMRVGCSRGVFTNEAGMGTASIAHASADVSHPAEQGLMGMIEVFLDTIVICTLTALVILTSSIPIPYGTDTGAVLTNAAFVTIYGDAAAWILAGAVTLFAVAAILGWGLYGARCAEFLFGNCAWKIFPWLQMLSILLSSVMRTATIWQISEILNGLMIIPNLSALIVLTPEICRFTSEFKNYGITKEKRGA